MRDIRQGVAFIAGKDLQWRPFGPRGKAFGRNWSAKKMAGKKRVREETIFVVVNASQRASRAKRG